MKTWVKGGLWGIVILVIFAIIFLFSFGICGAGSMSFLGISCDTISLFLGFILVLYNINPIVGILSYIIIPFVIGAIIGLIVSRIKIKESGR